MSVTNILLAFFLLNVFQNKSKRISFEKGLEIYHNFFDMHNLFGSHLSLCTGYLADYAGLVESHMR